MNTPPTGESPVSTQPGTPASASHPRALYSSAALLHHLHNDPSSHHITLSAGNTRNASASSSRSPRSEKPHFEVMGASDSNSDPNQPVAGPSSLKPLSRGPSRRGRPKTAPERFGLDGGAPSPSASPDMDFFDRLEVPGSPGGEEPLQHLESEGCIPQSMIAPEGQSGMEEAMDMMNISGGQHNSSGTRIVGAARGSMSDTSPELPTVARMMNPSPQPTWATFSRSYAHGLFDPHQIPNPPRSTMSPRDLTSAQSSPGKTTATFTSDRASSSSTQPSSTSTAATSISSASGSSGPVTQQPTGSMAASLAARRKYLETDAAGGHPMLRPDQLNLPSYSLAAATVRMASSALSESDFAPLGRPSPDRELTDPLSGYTSSGANPMSQSASSDPGSARYPLSRSMSSAITAHQRESFHLPTIQASPVNTPLDHPNTVNRSPKARGGGGGIVNVKIPPATAPLEKSVAAEDTSDYFGSASPPSIDRQVSYHSQSSSSQTVTGAQPTPNPQRAKTPPPDNVEPMDLPPPIAHASEIGDLFNKYGWLPAPIPPNEEARRKALYKFSILHTSPDVNFDRIAHMAKLVFSTKIVLIALIDGPNQWHKSESGLGSDDANRISSFCSHTILVSSGEPFVILDATQDWRFAQNPQVIGPPHIRFYAGAPLRTSDGYNLGSLCIIDNKPRSEFSPRSRLILKEFAAICMREMELWRDKLQLRVRDRIQTSMEQFTRECLEMDAQSKASNAEAASKMDKVYGRASELVCSTLDLDGCFILDISQFEHSEIDTPEGGKRQVYRADPYNTDTAVLERKEGFGPVNPFPVFASTPGAVPTRPLSAYEHERISDFLLNNLDGRIFEKIAPTWIRHMLPPEMRFGMVVPVFGVNQQPFALIVAYTSKKSKQTLEGYELQFLRAVGVILLSAALRRRMVLADKAKSILISSVSHELRTPLHGILASAELLSDTNLDQTQISFLKTVQTCGNSLIETVNHVLDFTKLSGSAGGGGSNETSIKLAKVNLATLVEQTVEGCYIGQRARYFMGDSDIGSFYAPPTAPSLLPVQERRNLAQSVNQVETVIDIAQREKGWMVRCEKGGLRRVLMNLVGNSLKFTKITLRELPHAPGATKIPVEMAVIDTGKGIGKEFLKDQLFHPFSQENPLQTGTGLGLAIVNSIVRSPAVDGKVDVWSSEGMGTEIRVSFEVETIDDEDETTSISSRVSAPPNFGQGLTMSLSGFDTERRGSALSLEVLGMYAAAAGFELRDKDEEVDIRIINDDESALATSMYDKRPLLFLTAFRSHTATAMRDEINRLGGSCQILYKPIGPHLFRKSLQVAQEHLQRQRDDSTPGTSVAGDSSHGSGSHSEKYSTGHTSEHIEDHNTTEEMIDRPSMSREDSGASTATNISHDSAESGGSQSTVSELSHHRFPSSERVPLRRRRSEENEQTPQVRPSMAPRGVTYHTQPPPPGGPGGKKPTMPPMDRRASEISEEGGNSSGSPQPGSPMSSVSTISTISLADGGVMLKAATLPPTAPRPARVARVMVVEDNMINRRVLGAFLKKRGYEYAEAHDGRAGVELFEQTPSNYWDVILMDISMPVMDGHQATKAIRKVEAARKTTHAIDYLSASSPPNASKQELPLEHAAAATPKTPSPTNSLSPGQSKTVPLPQTASPSLAPSAAISVPSSQASTPSNLGAIGAVIPPPPVVQARTKIFALTGLATSDDKREAFKSGVDGYLVKPVSLASLDLIFKKIGF